MPSSPQLTTTKAFLESFKTLDGEANIALRTPDCVHVMAPSSLNYPPSMTNQEWSSHLDTIKPILSSFPVVAKEIFEHDSSSDSKNDHHYITVWATSEAVFRDEVKDSETDWTFHGEYIFVLSFNESGDKIKRIVEFLDSKKTGEVRTLIERAYVNLAARKTTT